MIIVKVWVLNAFVSAVSSISSVTGWSHEEYVPNWSRYRPCKQSLTEHYFLCKDTTVHIYYVEKTLLEIGKKYFFKAKILKCKDTHGKDFSLTLTVNETLLRNTVLFYNHSIT